MYKRSLEDGYITTGGAGYVPNGYVSPTKYRQVYKSLTGKVFSTREEAIKDNTDAKYGRGLYASHDLIHSVVQGDTLWDIANANNTDVNTLRRLNPNIKGDLIRIGDKIKIGQSTTPTLHDVRKEWEKEKVLNTDNVKAIQGVRHKDNYVIIDKLNNTLTVYDKDNKELYRTSDISTGKSGNDYNTITYVDKNGKIRSGAGNESTPAGITKITGTGIYHGFPSYTRGRQQGDLYEDIASSLHFGGTKDKKASNGCVRIGGQSLQELSTFIGKGTDVYTLPEKAGSRFKVKDGKLGFVADNPYGKQEGDKKYWDDYNTYTNKSYSPLTIVDKKKTDNATYNKNRKAYADAIVNSKERLQKKFNIDSDTYNRIASLALGIAEQETKYGTANSYIGKQATRDILGDTMTDTVINPLGRAIRQLKQGSLPHNINQKSSRGLTQIKLSGDNKDTQEIYKQLGITEDSIDSPENSAVATMARLAQMYNTEVLGRTFTGAGGNIIDPYDALLYKWMGRNSELSNNTATPELNNYINNVKRYQNDFGLYTMRYGDGGLINVVGGNRKTKALGGKVKSSFVRSLETQPTILEQVAQYNKEPKNTKTTKNKYQFYLDKHKPLQQRIREQKAANQRERNIAKHYLAAGPNIVNLAKAAYHWYNSVPFLGGEPEDGSKMITGTVDVPGMRNPKDILKGVSAVGKLITKANAAKITPAQWTAAQDAAIARGDIAEAQRLRDLHFKVSASDTKIVDETGKPLRVYHGTKRKFKAFDESLYGSTDGGMYGTGVYTTPYKDYAEHYGDIIMDLYANIKNPVDARNFSINDLMLGKLEEGNNIFRWTDIGGKRDGVLGKNYYLNTKYPYEVISHKPSNVKSANAVTYDDKGIRIPLGDRDNFNINDIRYAIAPILAGGVGYGVYRNQKASGGSIHIAPSKRGTFTTAASKHGMGVQEFANRVLANKENYSPAMVKKANFARNARKWKYGLGGNLFSGKEEGSQQMDNGLNLFRNTNRAGEVYYTYQNSPDGEEVRLTPLTTIGNNPAYWTWTDDTGKVYTPRVTRQTTSTVEKDARNALSRAIGNYFGELKYQADNNIPISGKYTMPAIAMSALLPVAGEAVAGSSIAGVPVTTWADAALTSAFGAHGINHAVNEGINGLGDAAMTALELAPLGRLAKPVWNASKKELQYVAKAADNTARYVSPSYDLYRTIGETTPRTTPTLHGFSSSDLTGSGFVENVYTGSPLFEFGQTMKTSPEKAYFMRAPKYVDILKLGNGRFRHEVVGNEVLPSGEVNGKFVSYGEPWKEFALGENSALYEFPVGSRRGPSLMATDWKGREQKYSVDEVYDYMQQEEALRKELASIKETMGDDFLKQYSLIRRNLINEKYTALKEHIDTSIFGANQTVIPNERWNFDKFLKTPFWKYSENPTSGQVQKELMMRWTEAKSLETPTIEWENASKWKH